MGKISELDAAIQELRDMAARANDLANWLSELGINRKADVDEEVPSGDSTPPVTLEEVRAYLAEIARDGHTAEIRALIRSYGGEKLSDLPQECYRDLLLQAEEITKKIFEQGEEYEHQQ